MSRADVCLGIFGDNERAKLVLTNKVVEAIGVGKPLITSRNEPVQELLKDGESVLLVNPADPQALADAILRLKNDEPLRHRIAAAGHKVFRQQCATETFGKRFTAILHEVLGTRRTAE
jgi:glycosyltransferase involved in cell wall biosynthesis